MTNELFILPITSLFCNWFRKLYALNCQIWVQIWLAWHAGWLKHQDQGLCCMFSFVKDIQKLKYFFHLLWIWLLQWCTMGLETRRFRNATKCEVIESVPGILLKFIQCKCKLLMKNPGCSNVSSCRKHRLKCCGACGNCKGVNCTNAEEIAYDVAFR